MNHINEKNYEFLGKGDFRTLVRKIRQHELRICHKLSDIHLDVEGQRRQNVLLAAQLCSSSVAKAMLYLDPSKKIQAQALMIIDKWFDIFNSRLILDKKYLRCGFGIHMEEQNKALDEMVALVKNIIIVDKYAPIPFMTGIVNSIKSLRDLFNDLSREGYKYILTARLNQDCVENFFSKVWACGNDSHPGPKDCINRIKTLVVKDNRFTIIPNKPSVANEDDDDGFITNIIAAFEADEFDDVTPSAVQSNPVQSSQVQETGGEDEAITPFPEIEAAEALMELSIGEENSIE